MNLDMMWGIDFKIYEFYNTLRLLYYLVCRALLLCEFRRTIAAADRLIFPPGLE